MARISFSQQGASPFQNLLGHSPEILKHWNALETAFFTSATFSPELKEEVRRVLAHLNQCQYCMSKGRPSDTIEDEKTEKAVAFAQAMWENHLEISDHDFADLKCYFSDSEIAELCSFISFICASQKFGSTLALKASCSL